MVLKIISGGQTGADIAGLRVGKLFDFETGGLAPRGYETLLGPKLELMKFGLGPSKGGYRQRTLENIGSSDVTLVFAKNLSSPGTKLTINGAERLKVPCFVFHDATAIGTEALEEIHANQRFNVIKFLSTRELIHETTVINIAGNATQNSKNAFEFAFIQLWKILLHFTVPGMYNDEELLALAKSYKDKYD